MILQFLLLIMSDYLSGSFYMLNGLSKSCKKTEFESSPVGKNNETVKLTTESLIHFTVTAMFLLQYSPILIQIQIVKGNANAHFA